MFGLISVFLALKGVTIGENTAMAANSFATEDLPENMIAASQPAKIVKYL